MNSDAVYYNDDEINHNLHKIMIVVYKIHDV